MSRSGSAVAQSAGWFEDEVSKIGWCFLRPRRFGGGLPPWPLEEEDDDASPAVLGFSGPRLVADCVVANIHSGVRFPDLRSPEGSVVFPLVSDRVVVRPAGRRSAGGRFLAPVEAKDGVIQR